jgi:hypothetical protein
MDDSNKETENTRESSKNRAWGRDGNLASGEASMKGGNEVIERKSRDKEIPAESRQRSGINKQKRELSLGSSSSQESKRLRSNLKRSRAQTAQAQKMTEAYVSGDWVNCVNQGRLQGPFTQQPTGYQRGNHRCSASSNLFRQARNSMGYPGERKR